MCQEHMTDATLTQPWSSITSQTVHSSLVYYTCDILHKDYACGIYARCGFHFGMLLIVPYIVKGLYYLQYTISACLKLQHAKETHVHFNTLHCQEAINVLYVYAVYTNRLRRSRLYCKLRSIVVLSEHSACYIYNSNEMKTSFGQL